MDRLDGLLLNHLVEMVPEPNICWGQRIEIAAGDIVKIQLRGTRDLPQRSVLSSGNPSQNLKVPKRVLAVSEMAIPDGIAVDIFILCGGVCACAARLVFIHMAP